MGTTLLDKYSLLHFAVGIVAYFWSVGFWQFAALHTGFEFVENTSTGMKFINDYFTWWPGGKDRADNLVNQVGDTLSAMAGWAFARYQDSVFDRT